MDVAGRSRPLWAILVGGQLAYAFLLAVLLFRGDAWVLSDVALYEAWSDRVVAGELPYRDFPFDYPPLALAPMLVPPLATGFSAITYGTYAVLFAGLMAVLALAIQGIGLRIATASLAGGVASEADRAAAADRAVALMTFSLPVLLIRFEPWPILLTAISLLALLRGRPILSGVALGLGIAAKLYPALLVPVFAAHLWVASGRRSAVSLVLAAALTAAVAILPFAVTAEGGMLDTLRFQQGRGLQIETAAGGVIQLLNLVAPEGLTVVHVTTYELVSPRVTAYLGIQPVIAGVLVVLVLALTVYWIGVGGVRAGSGATAWPVVAGASLAVLLAFMLTNRALSPQHVFWLLPFAIPLTGARFAVLLAIIGRTLVVFPVLYDELLAQEPVAIVLLNVRNVLLAGLGVVALNGLREGRILERGRAQPSAGMARER
jgi:hypothetical protein